MVPAQTMYESFERQLSIWQDSQNAYVSLYKHCDRVPGDSHLSTFTQMQCAKWPWSAVRWLYVMRNARIEVKSWQPTSSGVARVSDAQGKKWNCAPFPDIFPQKFPKWQKQNKFQSLKTKSKKKRSSLFSQVAGLIAHCFLTFCNYIQYKLHWSNKEVWDDFYRTLEIQIFLIKNLCSKFNKSEFPYALKSCGFIHWTKFSICNNWFLKTETKCCSNITFGKWNLVHWCYTTCSKYPIQTHQKSYL